MEQEFLVKEQKFYDTHKAEFVEKYLGKEIVIYQNKVAGVFDTFRDAAEFTKSKKLNFGAFMIKRVTKREPVYQVIPSLTQVEGDDRGVLDVR